ncbi:LytTr DNA-binding domain-containing protein [Ekhidna lutea]|uniref:LytTr DNA-binding domain-containing protein n=2 Tax=Ekhidna lutea TaxID=447679 RepID=A0A239EZM3_EKHLU|nr:LytTr DNA-binding domain-containing protein [Ekhidna lutea]
MRVIDTIAQHRKVIGFSILISFFLALISFFSNWLMLIHTNEAPTPYQLLDISFYFLTPIVSWTAITIGMIHYTQRKNINRNRIIIQVIFIALLISPFIRMFDILIDFSLKNLIGMMDANPFSVLADVWLVVISTSPGAFLRILIIAAIVYYFLLRQSNHKTLTIRTRDGVYHVLEKDSICYLQSEGNYLNIQTQNGTYRTRKTLKSLAARLGTPFLRIHKSTIVNPGYIRQLSHWRNGEYLVVMNDGKPLTSSKSHRESIDKIMTDLIGNSEMENDPISAIVHPKLA